MAKRVTQERNKNMTRPRKTPAQRARRQKAQMARLVKLGVPEATVQKLNGEELRALLKRPAKLKKRIAAAG